MFLALREKRFAKRVISLMLKSHAAVAAARPDLSGTALYREVLLHTQKVDAARADEILREAEDSVDEWTARQGARLGFRQLVHFIIMSQYRALGRTGTIVSFRDIVYSRIPPDL